MNVAAIALLKHPYLARRLGFQDEVPELFWGELSQFIESAGLSRQERRFLECLRAIAGWGRGVDFVDSITGLEGESLTLAMDALETALIPYKAMELASQDALYRMSKGAMGRAFPREGNAVRVRLGEERPATFSSDPLLRSHTGYRSDLSLLELWQRARGLWTVNPTHALQAELLIVTSPSHTVVQVAQLSGLRRWQGKTIFEGIPLSEHPLVGQPDPFENKSPNPVTSGVL